MHIIKKSYIILILSLFLFGKSQRGNSNYISLDFAYDHYDIPIPTVVFNLDSFKTDELSFVGYKFRINKEEFISIENIVKSGSSYIIIDSLAERYYDINVIKNGRKTVYGTVNLHKSKELFAKILEQVRNSKSYPEISKAFEYLYSQLRPRE